MEPFELTGKAAIAEIRLDIGQTQMTGVPFKSSLKIPGIDGIPQHPAIDPVGALEFVLSVRLRLNEYAGEFEGFRSLGIEKNGSSVFHTEGLDLCRWHFSAGLSGRGGDLGLNKPRARLWEVIHREYDGDIWCYFFGRSGLRLR